MLRSLFLVLLLIHATLPIAPQIPVPAKKWSTLSGWLFFCQRFKGIILLYDDS